MNNSLSLSRRDFLKLSAAATASLALETPPFNTFAASASPKLAHALIFDTSALPRMRELFHQNAGFAYLRERLYAIDRPAVKRFIESEVRYNDQLYSLITASNNAEQLAFLYLMMGDQDAAELAADCVRAIIRFPRWDYFLEAGKHVVGVQRAPSSTIAVSLASDWLGDRITPEERGHWLEVMAERGCEPCYLSLYGIRYPDKVVGWSFDPTSAIFQQRQGNYTDLSRRPEITQTTNLRAVPAAALAIGAVAMRSRFGKSPDSERWLEMAIHGLEAFKSLFKPDGSYHEGVGYANYTTEHLAQAITVLQRSGEADLHRIVNWKGYVNYLLHLSMPTAIDPYGIVNFGDNGNPQTGEKGSVSHTAVPHWIVRQTKNETARWLGEHLTGSNDMWSLIWYDPDVKAQKPKPGNQLWHSDLDWIVARTGFTSDDLVVALRSGGPANHEHADRNAVIVKCYGEQLVTDPYRPPYSFADPAWPMRLTHAHSAVLIDGRGHQHHNGVEGTNASNAHARILQTFDTSAYAYWISDASLAYRLVDTEIKSVVRGILVFYDAPVVIVVDRVTKWQKPSRIQARFFGYNWDGNFRHSIMEDAFTIQRPNAIVHAQVYSQIQTTITAGKLNIPEERAQRHPFIEVASEPALATTIVTALAIGRIGDAVPQVSFKAGKNSVMVTAQRAGQTYQCEISEDGILPVIEVTS